MRIRTIKPEFWGHETLAATHPLTRLLAIGLLNYADDEGYFNAHPDLITSALFPYTVAIPDKAWSVPIGVQTLQNIDFLTLYTGTDGRTYGHINNFTRHQVINKPKPSKIKPLCTYKEGDLVLLSESGSDTGHLPAGTGKGNREKEQGGGNRESTPTPPASLVPVSDPFNHLAALKTQYPHINLENELRAALAHKRKTDRTTTTVDLAWFEAHWLPKCGPCFAPGGATQGTPAAIPPEPKNWRLTLETECPGNAINRDHRPWPKAWADLPPTLRRRLWPDLAA